MARVPVPGRSRVHTPTRGCARALELARCIPGFGSGCTAARWRDAVGCAGDHQRLDRGSEPGNEHENRWRGEAG
jgi:hypothetical protein